MKALSGFLNGLDSFNKHGGSFNKFLTKIQNSGGLEQFTLNIDTSLPLSIMDKFGLLSETQIKEDDKKLDNIPELKLQIYLAFRKAFQNYRDSIINFFNQSFEVLKFQSQLKLTENNLERTSLVNIHNSLKELPIFQQEFRKHFEKYIEKSVLEKIERKEQELLETLVYTWHQLVWEKKNILFKGDFIKVCKRRFNKVGEQLKKRLKDNLEKINILNQVEVELYEENSPIVILLYVEEAIKIPEGFSIICETLKKTFQNIEFPQLESYFLENEYDSFIIIPLIKERLVEDMGLTISKRAFDKEKFDFTDIHPEIIDESLKIKLDIQSWTKIYPQLNLFRDALNHLLNLRIWLNYVLSFKPLTEQENPDKISDEILQAFKRKLNTNISKYSKYLSTGIRKIDNIIDLNIPLDEENNNLGIEQYQNIEDTFETVENLLDNLIHYQNILSNIHKVYADKILLKE